MTNGIYYVRVVLDLYDGTGAEIGAGQAAWTLTSELIDTIDGMQIVQAPVAAVFRAGSLPAVSLVANDSPNVIPSGSQWQVAYTGVPGSPPGVSYPILAAPFSFTATAAAPCVFTAAGSSYSNGAAVALYGASLPGGFAQEIIYYVTGASGGTFQLAATAGGSPIASTSTGSGTVATAQVLLSSLTPSSVSPATSPFLTVSGSPEAGQVPVATGVGQQAEWGNASGLPTTTLGDTVYQGASSLQRLPGNTTTTRKFYRQQGSGSASAAPAWDTLETADLPAVVVADAGALTYGASIAVDASVGIDLTLTLTGSSGVIQNPSNLTPWQFLRFHIKQGPGGGFTVAYGSMYTFGAAGQPDLSATAGQSDTVAFQFDPTLGASGKLCYCGSGLGFS